MLKDRLRNPLKLGNTFVNVHLLILRDGLKSVKLGNTTTTTTVTKPINTSLTDADVSRFGLAVRR